MDKKPDRFKAAKNKIIGLICIKCWYKSLNKPRINSFINHKMKHKKELLQIYYQ